MKSFDKLFIELYFILVSILTLFFTLALVYLIIYPNEYKYVRVENPWNKIEYIKTIVFFIVGTLLCFGALYIGYKKIKSKKNVYSYICYAILALILFLLIRGTYNWYYTGFDHP